MDEAENFRKVLEALANENWDLRTAEGIAEDTKIHPEKVRSILKTNTPNFVRKSFIPDQYGRDLYTPAGRKIKFREYLARIHFILAPEQYAPQRT
ncbi:MAG: hypothetical protein AABW75_04225 [Nanoarchaeota archaeon]